MLKRVAFVMMCLSLAGLAVTTGVVIYYMRPLLYVLLW